MPQTAFRLPAFRALLFGLAAPGFICTAAATPLPADGGGAAAAAEVMRAAPADRTSADRVFREIVPSKRMTGEDEAFAKHEFLYPSISFLKFFQPYVLRVDDIAFLQDNARNLMRNHPDCRMIPGTEGAYTAKIACSRVSQFRAEGDEVIFNYSLANEVLVGGVYSFSTKRRARQFADMAVENLKAGTEVVTHRPDGDTVIYDSILFSVTIQPSREGYMVVIDAHHQDKISDMEEYGRHRLQTMDFGDFVVGRSRVDSLPRPDDLPKVCTEVSENRQSTERREYYGECFGFPYEAHMQLDFNPVTGILQTAVLSPIGAATGKIVNNMLTERYGLPQSCRRIESAQELVPIRRTNTSRRSSRNRGKLMRGMPAFVFAGTCDNPIIYTTDMRFVFENRYLNAEDLEADFERRKDLIEAAVESRQEYTTRMDRMKGFF